MANNLFEQAPFALRGENDARIAALETRLAQAELVTDFYYSTGLNNGTATAFTEIWANNAIASLPYNYRMFVTIIMTAGFNGASNIVTWDVRDGTGVAINNKIGAVLNGAWEYYQTTVGATYGLVIRGHKDYAAGATCGFRLAYKVNTSNVWADLTAHVRLVRR